MTFICDRGVLLGMLTDGKPQLSARQARMLQPVGRSGFGHLKKRPLLLRTYLP